MSEHSSARRDAAAMSVHDRAARHASLVDALARAETELARDLDAVGLVQAEARSAALYADLQAANCELMTLKFRDAHLRLAFDRYREQVERELRELADARIETFLSWVQRELDGLNARIVYGEGRGPKDPRTGLRSVIRSSNLGAIRRISAALVAARGRAEALKVTTAGVDIDAMLEELRRTIPTLEEAEVAASADAPEGQPAA